LPLLKFQPSYIPLSINTIILLYGVPVRNDSVTRTLFL